jgi:ATP-binding protein involved in chromosome partitioning
VGVGVGRVERNGKYKRGRVMQNIKHKFLVLSGKGGVGKSSIAVNLAVWLSMQGRSVGLLDIDIHGPSVPKLLNLERMGVQAEGGKMKPVLYSDTLSVMSIGFLLRNESDALIWRGPMKHNVIKQFVTDVCWGDLDYLIADCPPGTGDEPLSVAQLLGSVDGAVVVTTPQQLAVVDVTKCITFCRQLNLRVLGVVENMSGFVCPHCNKKTDIFEGDGGRKMAADSGVPFLGSVPIDPAMVAACDSGRPFLHSNSQSPAALALISAFRPLLLPCKQTQTEKGGNNKMRVAVPVTNGKLSAHFGHCEQFAIIDVGRDGNDIMSEKLVTPPPHEPGVLPKWLAEMNVGLIIAGGMGQRAQQLFVQNDIDVLVGASESEPRKLVLQYLTGQLQCGQNICDH